MQKGGVRLRPTVFLLGDSRNSTGITGQRWNGREGGRCRRWTCRRRSAVTPCCCPAAGDVEPWRYGQTDTASRGLEPERDRAELALLEQFTAAGKPVLGICRGMQVINVFFGGTLIQDLPGHGQVRGGGPSPSRSDRRLAPARTVGGGGHRQQRPPSGGGPPGGRAGGGAVGAGRDRGGAVLPEKAGMGRPVASRAARRRSGRGRDSGGRTALPGVAGSVPVREISQKKQVSRLTWCRLHGNISKLTISTEGRRRCSTMVRAPAFQAGDASSILVTCSSQIRASSSAG